VSAHVLNVDQMGAHVQLPMFMRATDIVSSLTGTLDSSYSHPDEVMESKLQASKGRAGHGHGTGVYESVKAHGVLNPVQLVHGEGGSLMQGQGHHRVAAAADIESRGSPKWVPVVHTDAREGTNLAVNAYSDPTTKKRVIHDYRTWSEHTPAIGHDIGWMMEGRR
jgi:hypothetical protein